MNYNKNDEVFRDEANYYHPHLTFFSPTTKLHEFFQTDTNSSAFI
jgi:hypothetical protein